MNRICIGASDRRELAKNGSPGIVKNSPACRRSLVGAAPSSRCAGLMSGTFVYDLNVLRSKEVHVDSSIASQFSDRLVNQVSRS